MSRLYPKKEKQIEIVDTKMAKKHKYIITAEVKKNWQEWGCIWRCSDEIMTEESLIKSLEVVRGGLRRRPVPVEVRNFQCVRV